MPGEACVLVDIRTIPGQSHPDIKSRLITLAEHAESQIRSDYANYDRFLNLDRHHDLKIRVDVLTDRPCTLTDHNDPVVAAADWATRQISAGAPTYAGVPGATDGTFLWALKNIPIVTMGAGDRQVPHQVDEWVDLDQLVETAKIYALAALHYLWPEGKDD
jgi:succinyl-diaminopimelate desuccinylase